MERLTTPDTALIFNVHLCISSPNERIMTGSTIHYAELKCLLITGWTSCLGSHSINGSFTTISFNHFLHRY